MVISNKYNILISIFNLIIFTLIIKAVSIYSSKIATWFFEKEKMGANRNDAVKRSVILINLSY